LSERLHLEGSTIRIGDRRWPVSYVNVHDTPLMTDLVADGVWHDRRVRISNEAGPELSILWGDGTYSTNHDRIFGHDVAFVEEPTAVEVGLWLGEELCGPAWIKVDDDLIVLLDLFGRREHQLIADILGSDG